MGFLDKMFGGGTNLTLKLDTNMIPEGGTLAGKITLSGGKKPLKLTALKVRLVYVKVSTVPGQSLPKIELQNLLDNTVISNQDLAPASLNEYPFSLNVPTGTDPKGTYKVIVSADIPGVKDPSADQELKVIAPNADGASSGMFGGLFRGKPSEEEILARFPPLMSAYDADSNFTKIAPFLAKKMAPGNPDRIRAQALATWGNVLNNRATPDNVKALEAMANDSTLTQDMLREVIRVAAQFAEEGAWPVVEKLSGHRDPWVREEMASRLYFDADRKLAQRKDKLVAMTNDPDAGVRAAAFRSFADFNKERPLVDKAIAAAKSDPSPDVQKACVSAIAHAHFHGMKDLVLDTFLAFAQSSTQSVVRKEIADCSHWLPADPRTAKLVDALLQDKDIEVRRQMAWQSCNMGEHPELRELFVRTAVSDTDEEVRGNALGGIDRVMPLPEAVAFLRQRLAADPNEKTAWACFNVVKFQMEHAEARAFMTELQQVPFARVAQRAREEIAGG
jgi:HEAT repeat protein